MEESHPWQAGWFTFAESRRQPQTQKILEDDQTDEETTVSGPDLSDGFSPAKVQQINQPDDVDEGVKIHVLPHGVEGGYETQLECRARDADKAMNKLTAGAGKAVSPHHPKMRWWLRFGDGGELGSFTYFCFIAFTKCPHSSETHHNHLMC